MWEGKALRRADCVSGFGFALLGGGVLYQASKIPMGGTFAGVDNSWYVSPAAFPLLLGVLFIISGACVFIRGVRGGGLPGIAGAFKRALFKLAEPVGRRGVIVVLLLFAYYGLLRLRLVPGWQGQNYIVSSAIFLSAFALCFSRPRDAFPKLPVILVIIGCAALLAWGVAALFSGPLRVPMP